ncbi:axin-2-like isoform X2 [Octopus sinensis]|uniref:Axin-2-like isoform X2 n=1 Tax=Octopus sinensis TaxID=2607531 RepID=A0A6P7U0E3_9MOLL|nr:axin-2-like isoform X2 [Octopus sinensis]
MDNDADIASMKNNEPPWFNNIDELLQSSKGLIVFKTFLDKLHLGDCLDFYFACKGVIKITEPIALYNHAKSLHRRFIIRGKISCISPEMASRIYLSVNMKDESVDFKKLFKEAKSETYVFLKDNYFRIFLLSPEYLDFLNNTDVCKSNQMAYSQKSCLNLSKSSNMWKYPSQQITSRSRYQPNLAVTDPKTFGDELSYRIENMSINRTQANEKPFSRSHIRPDDILEEHISKIWDETSIKEASIPLNIKPASCFAQRLNETARSMNFSIEKFPYSLAAPAGSLVVGYQFSNEKFPFRTIVNQSVIDLGEFKKVVGRKGSFRYFFKTACFDFDSSVAFVELFNDSDEVPLWEGKVFSKIFPSCSD